MGNAFVKFLEEKGLYEKILICSENISDLAEVLLGNVRLELYCKGCRAKRVFTIDPIYYDTRSGKQLLGAGILQIQHNLELWKCTPGSMANQAAADPPQKSWFWVTPDMKPVLSNLFLICHCTMNPTEEIVFALKVSGNYIFKIGQYPSLADLTFPELDVYKHVLQKEDRKEMGRAIGLFASGIGAGAYVYLRRIFERLLYQAADLEEGLDQTQFARAKVDEKIKMVKDILPPMLTGNPVLYGILSKGIHGLSEEQCLEYFPVLKDCIFMILEQWEEQRRKKAQQDSLTSALSKIASKI